MPLFALNLFSVSAVLKPSLDTAFKSSQDFDLCVSEASESTV